MTVRNVYGRSFSKPRFQKAVRPTVEQLDVLRIADRFDLRLRAAYLDAMAMVAGAAKLDELATLIERQDVEGVLRLLNPTLEGPAFVAFAAVVADAVHAGATHAAVTTPRVYGRNGLVVEFIANVTNPHSVRAAETISSTRIREITTDVRAVVRSTITQGIVNGDNPLDTARAVRTSIGLTDRQSRAVYNFRRMLTNLDREALTRELRDRRFDRTIVRAIENDTPLSYAQIDRMVERYRERYLKYRAEMIGRTESIRSIQAGQHSLFEQYIDSGAIEERQVRRFWKYTHDEKTRQAHREIPGMNPEGVGQHERFKTPLGPLLYPGDPSGEAANTIHCRCTAFTRVISLELLDDQ